MDDDVVMATLWADPDLASRPRTPIWIVPLVLISCVASMLLPPGPVRRWIALPVIVGAMAVLPIYSMGMIVSDYECMILVWMAFFRYMELAVLSTPETDFRKLKKKWKDDNEVNEWAKPDDLWGKLKWSAGLYLNFRGVGWSWSVRNIPDNELAGTSRG